MHSTLKFLLLCGLVTAVLVVCAAIAINEYVQHARHPSLPQWDITEVPTVAMERIARLQGPAAKECSGIIQSRQHSDLYWVHNDSGDQPRIYPVNSQGISHHAQRDESKQGVLIAGATNVDWEDIAADSQGNLLVCDVGNNGNSRRDLVIYVIPEPSRSANRAKSIRKYFVQYPDQETFPARWTNFNFDCEAVFTVDTSIFLLSKNRSNRFTTLYELANPQLAQRNTLTKRGTFNLQGQAVAADASIDGLQLVLMSYTHIWHFQRRRLEESFFQGVISCGRYQGLQVEAVCFESNDTVLIVDERTGIMSRIKLSHLKPVRSRK